MFCYFQLLSSCSCLHKLSVLVCSYQSFVIILHVCVCLFVCLFVSAHVCVHACVESVCQS